MTLLTVFVVLAVLGTLGVLATGIGSMAHGGEFDRNHSTQLMGMRVGLQALAILAVLAAVYFAGHG